MNKREITMEINDRDVTFTVDLASHNTYVNSMNPVNKVQPSHNFLMTCCAEEHKPFLKELITGEGGGFIAIQVASELASEYTPQVNIKVKKPSSTPTASTATA